MNAVTIPQRHYDEEDIVHENGLEHEMDGENGALEDAEMHVEDNIDDGDFPENDANGFASCLKHLRFKARPLFFIDDHQDQMAIDPVVNKGIRPSPVPC